MSPQQTIAHYRVTGKLGDGGMGAVYRATDTKLNRDVAIKVLPDSFAKDPDRLARFTREAQVLASLNHSNIAAIYGVEERAIVLKLVEGPNLAGPLSEEQTIPIIHQLIDALEYAHEHGVIHRDLKPANIKIDPDGKLKLLDFGLARAAETTQVPSSPLADSPTMTFAMSMPGVILGTVGYMSPEQARGGRVDHRTDIWAFGVDILASVLKSDVDLTKVPARFRPLIGRCLTRDVKHRLGWIGEACLLLDPPPETAVPKSRYTTAAAITALALVAGLAIWKFAPPPADPGLPAFVRQVGRACSSWI